MKKVLTKVRDSFPPFIFAHMLYCKWCRKRYNSPPNISISILVSNCIAGEILYDRRYSEYLKNDGRHNMTFYGIAFYKKRFKVVGEKLKEA